jgi:hypothetical protein
MKVRRLYEFESEVIRLGWFAETAVRDPSEFSAGYRHGSPQDQLTGVCAKWRQEFKPSAMGPFV